MSIMTMKLDRIKLVHSPEKLKLFASSAAHLQIAGHPEILPWTYSEFAAGDIWITRDAISIEIEVSYNRQPLDSSIRLRILETLGYGIRDAPVSLQHPQQADH